MHRNLVVLFLAVALLLPTSSAANLMTSGEDPSDIRLLASGNCSNSTSEVEKWIDVGRSRQPESCLLDGVRCEAWYVNMLKIVQASHCRGRGQGHSEYLENTHIEEQPHVDPTEDERKKLRSVMRARSELKALRSVEAGLELSLTNQVKASEEGVLSPADRDSLLDDIGSIYERLEQQRQLYGFVNQVWPAFVLVVFCFSLFWWATTSHGQMEKLQSYAAKAYTQAPQADDVPLTDEEKHNNAHLRLAVVLSRNQNEEKIWPAKIKLAVLISWSSALLAFVLYAMMPNLVAESKANTWSAYFSVGFLVEKATAFLPTDVMTLGSIAVFFVPALFCLGCLYFTGRTLLWLLKQSWGAFNDYFYHDPREIDHMLDVNLVAVQEKRPAPARGKLGTNGVCLLSIE